jgi:phosphopantothenoylcysteine decarboxylase/phosphopantothenate--cysteine ligase
MSEPEKIVEKIVSTLVPSQDLKKKHFLITAGGTREALDPVRYISNRSSGKMGYALAQAARERGAIVTLISANVDLPALLDIKPIKVESATQMLDAVMNNQAGADVIIMAAAVADFRPKKTGDKKIKKAVSCQQKAVSGIELEENIDILKMLATQKGKKGRKIVGFALETDNLIANAKKKLKEKRLDLIVANGPESFGSDQAKVVLIDKVGKTKELPLLQKTEVANKILDIIQIYL